MIPTINLLKKYPIRKRAFAQFPQTPGIYIFWGKSGIIYIGKAVNLKSRLKSYLSVALAPKTARMVSLAQKVSFLKVGSELEALLLEAKLIYQFQPKYNFQAKDDKHPLYIKIPKEEYPTVKTARKLKKNGEKLFAFYGPFPNSRAVKDVLKMVRKLFPFSDHKLGKKPCLYSHLGLCNPCPNYIQTLANQNKKAELKKEYLTNIKHVKKLLDGGLTQVFKILKNKMEEYSQIQEYEKANKIKKQLNYFEYITTKFQNPDSFLDNPNLKADLVEKELKQLASYISLNSPNANNLGSLKTIECFDVAHLSGTQRVASMVTFINGEAEKVGYKHFKLSHDQNNDYEAMVEIAQRRFKHLKDWGTPNLLLIDGGKSQVKAFKEVFDNACPVIGFAKGSQALVIPQQKGKEYVLVRVKKGPTFNLISRIIAEVHRFAQRYHHTLIKKALLDKTLLK